MNIKLSIALVTRNRPDSLERTLKSIGKQDIQPYEIIISDDSDNLTLKRKNISLAKLYGCIYVEGQQRGLYANRNFTAKKCSGTHVRTMDDDHEFPENHFEKCFEAIELEPSTIWTIGEYSHTVKEAKRMIPSPIAGQLHPRGYSYTPKNMNDYYGISCGGTIYPISAIDKNILNCDYYKFGMMYLEYGARLKKTGYTIKPLRTTYIIHHSERTTASELTVQIINEARLFAMFCLAFSHQPEIKNKLQTVLQIVLEVSSIKYSLRTVFDAFKNYRKFIRHGKNIYTQF
jgi:glycosyltransferase involved in cell wall biosynthesis